MKIKTFEKIFPLLVLIGISATLYCAHFMVFHDMHHIFIYLLGDIAFLPLEILLVSIIFQKIIEEREKRITFKKLSMVIGVFFSETGTKLLHMLSNSDQNIDPILKILIMNNTWTKKDFEGAYHAVDTYTPSFEFASLSHIRQFLNHHRTMMLKIIENPTLLEHELFSELMMAVFHLQEELYSRPDTENLPHNDLEHIKMDAARAYGMLLKQWLMYMQHLKEEYPYLFSFAIRTNPFDIHAKVQIS